MWIFLRTLRKFHYSFMKKINSIKIVTGSPQLAKRLLFNQRLHSRQEYEVYQFVPVVFQCSFLSFFR